MTRSLVVVGNGMVGQRFVDDFVAKGGLDTYHLTVVGEEPTPAYDRVALSSWFDGVSTEDLLLSDTAALERAGVEFRFGTRVTSIDAESRKVVLSDGTLLAYDELVLATGSRPFVPPIPGHDRPGCFVYRTIEDLEQIRDWAAGKKTGVIIGGGLLGLEGANALVNLGLDTHVVEMADRLMPQQLDEPGSAMLAKWIDDLGITTHLGFATSEIAGAGDGDDSVDALVGPNGVIECDIVVFSAGIRPCHELAADAGLEIGPRGGIVVNDYLETSVASISAIGEVACHDGRTYGLVGPGYAMASALAARLTGADDPSTTTFEGADLSTKLKLLGVEVASFGEHPVGDQVTFADPSEKVYRSVSLRDGNVAGGVLVGDASNYDLLHAMATGAMATSAVGSLIAPVAEGAAQLLELPDSAILCSCNGVSRGQLKDAICAGDQTVPALKASTNCGTGCGGCVPGMSTLLNETLVDLGIEIDTSLCEHFPYSRQELFDIVRIRKLTTWSSIITELGSGLGCEICRPTVASILASQNNGYVLTEDQAGLQDTNDRSLANMQRNGTYSVVPRVPGGEITPEQLIALGEIGRDYDLYAKITGAQRIDLFGAQLHELPGIWQRAIDAGLESGQAYGKALRTVKSCVGSTWCRYGVQDAVGMAIRIERRYRGLRAPHKLKSAVSGCTRECAEAQSKDFGVIATETGWNLYLCGNGGRVPRHADLFATDLSDEALITTIDRFLMFYIRTADKLERTSTWFERLEGGLEYLRSVIVDDSLGICDELDAAMAAHVETYECEWTATLEDPDKLAHFVEFVNAPDEHSAPVWIRERGQRIPAP